MEAIKSLNTTSGTKAGQLEPGWEVVVEKKGFKVWKRPIPDSHLYEYRGQTPHNLTTFYCTLGFIWYSGWCFIYIICLKSLHSFF